MTEAQVRAIAVFFYYVLPHELLAMEATDKAIKELKAKKKKSEEIFEVLLIKTCNTIARKKRKEYLSESKDLAQHNFPKAYDKIKEPLIKPSTLSVAAWRQILRDEGHESLYLLVWAHVLEFPIDYIVLASECSHGTVMHRLSQSLNLLGSYLQPGGQSWGTNA